MSARRPMYVASDRAGFYPASPQRCRELVERCLAAARPVDLGPHGRAPLGGIVPHAGWIYSGPTAAWTFANLARAAPETVVIFGAVHVPGVPLASVWPEGEWETPLGPVAVDSELAAELLESGAAEDNRGAHEGEHAIEVELPFLAHLHPGARVLPVAVPPDSRAPDLGRATALAVKKLRRRAVPLGSTDLTHYGARFGFAPRGTGPEAHRWAKEENDRTILEALQRLDPDAVVREARERSNACGGGAAAAAAACARELGARTGQVLHHTSSAEVQPGAGRDSFVCYASVVFVE